MALAPAASGVNVVTTGSANRVVLRLAIPTVIAMLAQSAVNEVDIYFLSRLPNPEGSNAQAALLPSLILLWLFGGSLSAISVGTQALTARRYAEGKPFDAGAVVVNSATVAIVTSFVFTLVAYFTLPFTLKLLIDVPEVREAARGYLGWRLVGILSMVTTFSFKAFFDGIGKTHVHMIASIVMNIANVLLCIALIFGNWGAPRMGFEGAGVAGFISTWIGLAITASWVLAPRYSRAFRPFDFSKLSRPIITELLVLSVPSAIATIAVMSGFGLFQKVVSVLDHASSVALPALHAENSGAVNGAATTIIVGILKLTFTACLAFGTSTATLVSQSLGEGDGKKAENFGWVSVRLGLVIFGVVGLLEGVVLTHPLLRLVAPNQAVYDAALVPMRMMGIATPLIATGMILTQALFGAGNTRFVMIVELLLHFLCLVPLSYLLGVKLGIGLVGIWSAAFVYAAALTTIMVLKFRSGDWKTIKI
jgi:putative MATE family efflux protein